MNKLRVYDLGTINYKITRLKFTYNIENTNE